MSEVVDQQQPIAIDISARIRHLSSLEESLRAGRRVDAWAGVIGVAIPAVTMLVCRHALGWGHLESTAASIIALVPFFPLATRYWEPVRERTTQSLLEAGRIAADELLPIQVRILQAYSSSRMLWSPALEPLLNSISTSLRARKAKLPEGTEQILHGILWNLLYFRAPTPALVNFMEAASTYSITADAHYLRPLMEKVEKRRLGRS